MWINPISCPPIKKIYYFAPMNADLMEYNFIRNSEYETILNCMGNNYIQKEFYCKECLESCKLIKYKKSIDSYAWRCYNTKCCKYKFYYSIRDGSFFKNFRISLLYIFRIVIRYGTRQSMNSIKNSLNLNPSTIEKVIKELISRIPECNFSNNKLGGPGKIVQVDETMLNFKTKSQKERSSENKCDSISIVEFDTHITRAFACIIPDKKATTLIPIICEQVASNRIIRTDEHRSYSNLSGYFTSHGTVCHKYQFVNGEINTQAVESFHNELKLEIKRRK